MIHDLVVFRVDGRFCALPVGAVAETMRPLPVDPIPETPPFIAGASIIRGTPTPIIDLGALLAGKKLEDASRVVTVRCGTNRLIGILVSEVMGVHDGASLSVQPPTGLLAGVDRKIIEALGRLDNALLSVLHLGHVVPDPVWAEISKRRVSQ